MASSSKLGLKEVTVPTTGSVPGRYDGSWSSPVTATTAAFERKIETIIFANEYASGSSGRWKHRDDLLRQSLDLATFERSRTG